MLGPRRRPPYRHHRRRPARQVGCRATHPPSSHRRVSHLTDPVPWSWILIGFRAARTGLCGDGVALDEDPDVVCADGDAGHVAIDLDGAGEVLIVGVDLVDGARVAGGGPDAGWP